MNRMQNPPHPGERLREEALPDLALTITEAARQLHVTRAALSRVAPSYQQAARPVRPFAAFAACRA